MDKLSDGLPSVGDLTINCVYTALLQPVNVVKILIQVSHIFVVLTDHCSYIDLDSESFLQFLLFIIALNFMPV